MQTFLSVTLIWAFYCSLVGLLYFATRPKGIIYKHDFAAIALVGVIFTITHLFVESGKQVILNLLF